MFTIEKLKDYRDTIKAWKAHADKVVGKLTAEIAAFKETAISGRRS